jgi:hypothetical protein
VGSTLQPRDLGSALVITGAQVRESGAGTAYDVLTRLRPEFLSRHAYTIVDDPEGGYPVVYVNGVRQGGLDLLKTIPAAMVAEIRYISPGAASDRFGRHHAGGVIAVRARS